MRQAEAGTFDDLAWMYKPSEVVRIHLTMDEGQIAALNAHVRKPRNWVGGIGFRIEGSGGKNFGSESEPWLLEAKLKGNTSFRTLDGKASFNFKFASGSRPDGLKRMTLNNMVSDGTYIREMTSYRIFRALGLPAYRAGYAQIWINDQYYGLYTSLEKYTDQSLEHLFPGVETGHLYENAAGRDILRTGDDLKNDFEVDEGDESDLSDLEDFAAAVRTGEWSEIQGRLADPQAMIIYLAAEWYLGHWDGYFWKMSNYYLHSDASGRFTMLPSGADQTLSVHAGSYDLSFPIKDAMETWTTSKTPGALLRACIDDTACQDDFVHGLQKVRRAVIDNNIPAQTDELGLFVRPLIAGDPNRPISLNQAIRRQGWILDYLTERDLEVKELLATHPLDAHSVSLDRAPYVLTDATDAVFEFSAPGPQGEGVEGFECRLDHAEFEPCASPMPYEDLAAGAHDFAVRAINRGATPSSPTTHSWIIHAPELRVTLAGAVGTFGSQPDIAATVNDGAAASFFGDWNLSTHGVSIPADDASLPTFVGDFGSISFTVKGAVLTGVRTLSGDLAIQGPVQVEMALAGDDGDLSCRAITRIQLSTDRRGLYNGAGFTNGLEGPGALAANWDSIPGIRGDAGCGAAAAGLVGPGGMLLTR